MQRMTWVKELYGTGIEEIDRQHKEFFRRVNAVMDSIENKLKREEIGGLMKFLGEYAVSHFSFEEGVMERRACASCKINKEAHAQFLREYKALQQKYEKEGVTDKFLQDLEKRLMDWFRLHIMCIDTKLRDTAPPPENPGK